MLPVQLVFLLEGKAPTSFIAEITGLSPSRMRKGGASRMRASTEKKALEALRWYLVERAAKRGYSSNDVDALYATAPSTLSGKLRPYADFIHGLNERLPLTQMFGEAIDDLIEALQESFEQDDLQTFKHLLMQFDRWSADIQLTQQAADKFLQRYQRVAAATDWQAVITSAAGLADDIMLCFLSAMDAEHGATYFTQFRPLPLFPQLMPKLRPDIDLNNIDISRRRNLVYRPSRRLIELSHAMMEWLRYRAWPKQPAGRKQLAEALDQHEQFVGNLFDGTKKLTGALYSSLWDRLCKNVAQCEPCRFPLPLLVATLFWQSGLITTDSHQKIKTVVLLEQDEYISYWAWHRQRWASQLTNGSEGWPVWFTD